MLVFNPLIKSSKPEVEKALVFKWKSWPLFSFSLVPKLEQEGQVTGE
jgi:hypothetical protein